VCNAEGRIFNNMPCVRKAKHVRKRQTHLLLKRMLRKDYHRKCSVKKTLVVGLKGLDAKTN
jgi:hypothetical protein